MQALACIIAMCYRQAAGVVSASPLRCGTPRENTNTTDSSIIVLIVVLATLVYRAKSNHECVCGCDLTLPSILHSSWSLQPGKSMLLVFLTCPGFRLTQTYQPLNLFVACWVRHSPRSTTFVNCRFLTLISLVWCGVCFRRSAQQK